MNLKQIVVLSLLACVLALTGYTATDQWTSPSEAAEVNSVPTQASVAEPVEAPTHGMQALQVGLFTQQDQQANWVLAKNEESYGVGDKVKQAKVKPNFDPAYPEIDWDALLPKGWDPMASLKGLNLATLQDSDPRAMEALDKMKKAWSEAPVESSLNGKKVRIPGFAVPLEQTNKNVSELLLVPYFGACIHTPPPPSNQIIHVKLKQKTPMLGVMQPYWVWGELKVARNSSAMGDSGYRLEGASLLPYED